MRNTNLAPRRFSSRAATASPSVDQASPARRGQPGTPSVTTRGDAVATKGCSRASSRSGSSRHSVGPSGQACTAPLVHSRIGSPDSLRVNTPETGGLSPVATNVGAHFYLTSERADSSATIPLRCICIRSGDQDSGAEDQPHVAGNSDKSHASLVGSSFGIVLCLFTALTGGLPIKWALQLLGAIQ